MAFAQPNLQNLQKRGRLGSLQENTKMNTKGISCRKRILSDTDTQKSVSKTTDYNDNSKSVLNLCESKKLISVSNKRIPLQDIKNNTNLGAIPKIIQKKYVQKSRTNTKYIKQKSTSKIQTPKIPKPKKITKVSNPETDDAKESFMIPKFVTTARGESCDSQFLPDLLTDSFAKFTSNLNLEQLEELDGIDILGDSKDTSLVNRKRSRGDDSQVQYGSNKENIILKRNSFAVQYERKDIPKVFSKTYLEDTVRHYLCLEEPGRLGRDRSIIFNRTINWLIEINDNLNENHGVLFTAVILFDRVLSTMELSWNSMQLAGLACFRIIHKHFDAVLIPWPLIASQIKATLVDLNKMEQNILERIKFKIDIAEPTIFVSYYLELLRNNEYYIDEKVENCVFYILECLLLSSEFYTKLPSQIGAAAIDLALEIFNPESCCWSLLVGKIGYYGYTELKDIKREMLNIMLKIEDTNYPHRSSFIKYSRIYFQSVSTEIKEKRLARNLILTS